MQRVNYKNLELLFMDAGGSPFYRYQGIPFTGIVEFYYESGIISSEEEYEDGYQQGWVRYYYENGNIESEYKAFDVETVPGTYKRFDENGNLVFSM